MDDARAAGTAVVASSSPAGGSGRRASTPTEGILFLVVTVGAVVGAVCLATGILSI